MARIVLGVTGGIAAYKSIDVLRILQTRGHDVRVIMTRSATRFVGPATFAALSGREVGVSMFAREERPGYHHLDLMDEIDVFAVAPMTANTLARFAGGLADDLLTSCYLAFVGPMVIAPAMNTRMYEHPATQANLETVRRRGATIVDPESGLLADGEIGVGRLAPPLAIVTAVERAAGPDDLTGRRVLISAGGTREPLDAVRYLGNRSSGKMGWALADAARRRGAEVTVVAANVALPRRRDVAYVDAPTAAEMADAMREQLERADVVIMTAAVADYRPTDRVAGKIDKSRDAAPTLGLERTEDILTGLVARSTDRVMVGFAAEYGPDGLERAREKRRRKGVDILVYNDVANAEAGFGSERNAVTIIGPGEREKAVPLSDKSICAERILDAVVDVER